MNKIFHVYECKSGKHEDLVLGETFDHAKKRFVHLTTLQGKTITAEVKVKLFVASRGV